MEYLQELLGPATPKGHYELLYFPVPALGDPIALALAIGGFSFTYTTTRTDEHFHARRKELSPYGAEGQVPLLICPNGKVLCQSRAILRYVGKTASYAGAPLYPADPLAAYHNQGVNHSGRRESRRRGQCLETSRGDAAAATWIFRAGRASRRRYEVDALIDLAEDARSPILHTFSIQDQLAKEAARKKLFASGGKIHKWMAVLDRELAKDPMTTLSIAHLYIFSVVNTFRPSARRADHQRRAAATPRRRRRGGGAGNPRTDAATSRRHRVSHVTGRRFWTVSTRGTSSSISRTSSAASTSARAFRRSGRTTRTSRTGKRLSDWCDYSSSRRRRRGGGKARAWKVVALSRGMRRQCR